MAQEASPMVDAALKAQVSSKIREYKRFLTLIIRKNTKSATLDPLHYFSAQYRSHSLFPPQKKITSPSPLPPSFLSHQFCIRCFCPQKRYISAAHELKMTQALK